MRKIPLSGVFLCHKFIHIGKVAQNIKYMELLKTLGRLTVPGLLLNDIKWLFSRITGKPNSNLYDDIGSGVTDFTNNLGVDLNIGSGIGSLFGRATGAAPTGQDIWNQQQYEKNLGLQYQYERELRSTAMQDTISDFQKSGVNPAMAYGSGPTSVSAPSGAGPGVSPGTMSDLIALMTLPAQLGLIKAQTKKVEVEAENTAEDTRIKSITADWMPSINDTNIKLMLSSISRAYSEVDVNKAQENLIKSQTDVQDITKEYLPEKLQSEIANLQASSSNLTADEAYKKTEQFMLSIQANFAKKNGFLMSQSDTLLVCTYIASLLGLSKDSVQNFIQNELPKQVHEVVTNTHFGTPGGPHM